MGYIRKMFLSPATLGAVRFESKKEKALRENKKQSKIQGKQASIQEQMLFEQRRANDLKERELMLSHPDFEDPPTDEERAQMFPDMFGERVTRPVSGTPKVKSGIKDWWNYANPKKG
jgi:hypothetical protein